MPSLDSPSLPVPPLDAQTVLRSAVGLFDIASRGLLELSGVDRLRFLHGLVSCDVKGLVPGSGTYGFFTSGQGKVLTDFALLAFEDRLWLDLPPGMGEEIAAHLAKYVIADRVEIRAIDGGVPVALVGAGLVELLPELASLPEGAWGHGKVEIGGVEVELCRNPRFGAPGAVAWVSAEIVERFRAAMIERGARPVGFEDLEVLRVEAGIPRFGVDFGPENFPQETGQEEAAVSYTKGCYLGQEVIARIHYRGGVQRSLRGLKFSGAIPEKGAVLRFEEREAGAVGSTARSTRFGAIGLAVVHKRGAAAGTRLTLPDGSLAEVVDLPF